MKRLRIPASLSVNARRHVRRGPLQMLCSSRRIVLPFISRSESVPVRRSGDGVVIELDPKYKTVWYEMVITPKDK